MANESNLSMRLDRNVKVRYDVAAAVLETTTSDIVKKVLADGLAAIEADAEAARLAKGGIQVSAAAVEDAVRAFMSAITDGHPIRVHPSELYGPESKALWLLLSHLWEHDDGNDKARKKLAAWLESLNIKANIAPPPPKPNVEIPPPKPVKSYARKNAE